MPLSGYTLLGADSRDAGRAAIAAGRRAGVPVSVDASSAAPIRAVGADRFLGWIQDVDLLFANDDEVAALGGEAQILAAVGALVAKHGAAGAEWTDGRDRVTVDAVAAPVVDSTGAGDAPAAGFLAARSRGGEATSALGRVPRSRPEPSGRPAPDPSEPPPSRLRRPRRVVRWRGGSPRPRPRGGSDTPSLARMFETWTAAVRGEMYRRSPSSAFE